MGYNRENYLRVRQAFEDKRAAAERLAEAHLQEVRGRIPAIAHIDSELAGTGVQIMNEIAKGKPGLEERLAIVRRDNEALQNERRRLLNAFGYPADYTEPKFDCKKCRDTGFSGDKMCSCMRFQLTVAGLESSGLARLFETQNFDSFSLKYYQSDPKVYSRMTRILEICSEFAENFDSETRENLLLCGKTGLGKTHLSTAMAGVIIGRGYDVVYESAQNLFDEYSGERFGRRVNGREANTGRFTDCDLLIVDDLGTESSNAFTVSCLYNLINVRLLAGKPLIFSTNLTSEDLQKRYDDRIYSRLAGEFTVLPFCGTDIRMQKRNG